MVEQPSRYCTNCGHGLNLHDRFCPKCGRQVQEVAKVPTPGATVSVPPASEAQGAAPQAAAPMRILDFLVVILVVILAVSAAYNLIQGDFAAVVLGVLLTIGFWFLHKALSRRW